MEVFGIKFAPLNVPLNRRLETLSAATGFFLFAFLGFIAPIIAFYLLFTKLWLLVSVYLFWIFVLDSETCEKGGRQLEWVRNWKLWSYAKDYYPVKLKVMSSADFDPKRNYLFCYFPHGVFATGAVISLSTGACNTKTLFPNHKTRGLTLKQNFYMPFYRDFLLCMGVCSVSAKSINFLLGSPNGGNIAVLVVGGAAEAFHSRPGDYRLVLKNRKGFVKLAIKNGCPLVPVFGFGEIDLFDQPNNSKYYLFYRLQQWLKRLVGFAPIIPLGRGYFQYSYGVIPRRKPINVVVGKPIEVKKDENPTQDDIDTLHDLFMNKLIELFDEHKKEYLENPDTTKLIIY